MRHVHCTAQTYILSLIKGWSNQISRPTRLNTRRLTKQHLSPEVEQADERVQQDVDEVVAERPQLVQQVVPAERQHAQRTVRLVRVLLKSRKQGLRLEGAFPKRRRQDAA